jgi:tetratricopeptide (TPR) repeat protein
VAVAVLAWLQLCTAALAQPRDADLDAARQALGRERFAEATSGFEAALAIALRTGNRSVETEARAGLADVALSRDDPRTASAQLDRLTELAAATDVSHHARALAYQIAGDIERAVQHNEKSLDSCRRSLGLAQAARPGHDDLAWLARACIVRQSMRMQQPVDAGEISALVQWVAAPSAANPRDRARALLTIAEFQFRQGNGDESGRIAKTALDVCRSGIGDESICAAEARVWVGGQHFVRGWIPEALFELEVALATSDRLIGHRGQIALDLLGLIGVASMDDNNRFRDLSNAADSFTQALRILDEQGTNDFAQHKRAELLFLRGFAYTTLSSYQSAQSDLQESFDAYAKLPQSRVGVARQRIALQLMAKNLRAQGHLAEADEKDREAARFGAPP